MTTETTPQQMLEWLDIEMGLAQSRAVKSGDDTQFWRLKAIYDYIKHNEDGYDNRI